MELPSGVAVKVLFSSVPVIIGMAIFRDGIFVGNILYDTITVAFLFSLFLEYFGYLWGRNESTNSSSV